MVDLILAAAAIGVVVLAFVLARPRVPEAAAVGVVLLALTFFV